MIGVAAVLGRAYHVPVMVAEVLRVLAPRVGGTYLDGTVGGGGHAEAILSSAEGVRLYALDRDPEAVEEARSRLRLFADRVRLAVGDFADVHDIFGLGEGTLDGVLLDLGVSSHQIDLLERGFTFRPGAPLDMRMGGAVHGGQTAAAVLNQASEGELRDIFRRYGEERRPKRLVREVVARRAWKPFETSDDLVAALEAAFGRPPAPSDRARIFQALRIAVNRELESLTRGLSSLKRLLGSGGRLVVISYHSLEDRIVKRAFALWSRACVCPPGIPVCQCGGKAEGRLLVRRALVPSESEVLRNPRARSGKLRAWERA
ncbi:MAG: 16S rRNA (cytosine(1402)-N(4))-methyltransferase RsmH [Gemmatimonadetes bacterium]|nr:16S rRNA (cytosine(1402)-N(4))-methyltransferase RsmH [Gemmatimonadota bacterium]